MFFDIVVTPFLISLIESFYVCTLKVLIWEEGHLIALM